MQFLIKFGKLPYDPTILLLCNYSREKYVSPKNFYEKFTAALFIIATHCKTVTAWLIPIMISLGKTKL